MPPSVTDKDSSARSPFAGCAIFVAAIAVMVFLIGFSILTLFRQYNEIAKFTDVTPVTIEVSSLDNKEAELNQLAERIESFRQQLAGNDEASLILSAADLNLIIATYDLCKELRCTFRVTSIDREAMHIAISFPLNGRPRFAHEGEPGWIASDQRFLNGTMVAKPNLLKHEVVLSIENIDVPGKKVAAEFIDQMSPYRITERYLTHPNIGPAMAKLTRVSLEDDKLVLTRKPNEVPADLITHAQVDSASGRLFTALGIAAVGFLVFAGIIVMIGARAKARKAKNL
jgi:hypothetical protein